MSLSWLLRGHAMSLFLLIFFFPFLQWNKYYSIRSLWLNCLLNSIQSWNTQNGVWNNNEVLLNSGCKLNSIRRRHKQSTIPNTASNCDTVTSYYLYTYVDCIYFYYLANRGACMVKYREALSTTVLLAL